jgi:hypothetical protein
MNSTEQTHMSLGSKPWPCRVQSLRAQTRPPDSDAHSHPHSWALLQVVRTTTSQRSCMQTIQDAYIAQDNRKVDQAGTHCYCYMKNNLAIYYSHYWLAQQFLV